MALRTLPLPDSDIPCIRVPDLTGPDAAHGFFGRQGGISGGIYAGLNCGVGSGDDAAHVAANRKRVAEVLGIKPVNLLSLYQIHGHECRKINFPPHPGPLPGGERGSIERPKADAHVTDVPGLALSILTADCAPVLFYGRTGEKPVIGAAHAGWRGALSGILDSTVYAMEEYGVKAGDIRVAIGPCIGKRSYEVGAEFAEKFLQDDPENEKFFMNAAKAGHLLFDLAGYCAMRLYDCGVMQVSITGQDTFAREDEYFSYRRTTHRGEPDYGRQISAIVIL